MLSYAFVLLANRIEMEYFMWLKLSADEMISFGCFSGLLLRCWAQTSAYSHGCLHATMLRPASINGNYRSVGCIVVFCLLKNCRNKI